MANPLLQDQQQQVVNPLTGQVSEAGPVGMRQNTVSNQISAGIDSGQALLQRGGQALAEAFGFGDSEFALNMVEDAQKNEARAARVPVEGLGDQVLRGLGSVGVSAVPAIATLPFGGVGAIGAGIATSIGMNLGDIKSKELELDADREANLADVLAATGLGALESIPLFRFKKALTPISDAVKKTAKEKLVRGTLDTAKSAGVGGAIEGSQDFTTSILAHNFTGTDITPEALDRIIDASIDEAIVGSILSGPIGAVESTAKIVKENQALADLANFTEDENGNPVMTVSVEDKFNTPGLFKKAITNLVGRTPDKILTSEIGGLVSVRKLLGKFVQNPTETARQLGIQTVGNRAQLIDADLQKAAKGFLGASDKAAKEAIQARIGGSSPKTEEGRIAFESLSKLFDEETLRAAEKAGILEDVNWRDSTYIPLMNVDANKVAANKQEFLQKVRDDLVKQGKDDKEIRGTLAKADSYVDRLGENGFYQFNPKSENAIGNSVQELVKEAEQDKLAGKDASAANKKLANKLRKSTDLSQVRQDNPLEQERFLKNLSQEFWGEWTTNDDKGNVFSYIKSISERLAHAEMFGKNLEGYFSEVREALADAAEKGITITPEMIDNFVDVINISQRIPTKKVSLGWRTWQNRVRAFENITKLPLALIPSLAEVMVVADRFGSGTVLSAVGKQIKLKAQNIVRSNKDSITPAVVDDLGLSVAEATNIMSSRLGDDTFNPTLMEQRFFNLTGLPQFTEILRITAALSAERSLLRDAQTYTTTDNKGIKRALLKKFAEAGLDGNKVADWYNQGAKKSDPYYENYIRMGLLNLVEDTVVNPTPIARPAWTSDERLKLLAQMKSFATVFTNSVMRSWWDRIAAAPGGPNKMAMAGKLLPTVATMMMVQVYMGALREFLKTGDIERWEDDDVYDHMLTGVSYLGMGGFITDPIKADQFGSDASSVLLGPAVSDFNKAMSSLAPILSGEVSPEEVVGSVMKTLAGPFPDFGLLD